MTASPRLRVYLSLSMAALIAAVLLGRPELAVLATPFLVFVVVALAAGAPASEAELRLERDGVLEGETVRATVTVRNRGASARVDVRLPAVERLDIDPTPRSFWLACGERREIQFELTAGRWGVYEIGPANVAAHDPLAAFTVERQLGDAQQLRVYAQVDRLQHLVTPRRTRPVLGSQVSRELGEGIEFADLRPLAPGDRVRSINWRATARRRAPYINVQHPEHSADVVLFLDTFAEADLGEHGTLDAAVRAAATLAATYLAWRDRVALVSLGGTLSWLAGSPGPRQLYRIIDALFSSQVKRGFRWTGVTHLPRQLVPAHALVLALSPLLDDRGIGALLDLRARGHDVVVLEISPVPGDATDRSLTVRLWRLHRDAVRNRFAELGIATALWEPPYAGVESVIEEVITLRRHAREPTRV
jgi:uncharacterized protein (DUF58 family)